MLTNAATIRAQRKDRVSHLQLVSSMEIDMTNSPILVAASDIRSCQLRREQGESAENFADLSQSLDRFLAHAGF